MIRSLKIIFLTLALANMLAVVGLVGWLAGTNRLSGDRLETVRTLFSTTVAQDEAKQKADEAKTAAAEAAAKAALEAQTPPISTEDKLALQTQFDSVMQQNMERTRRTLRDMRKSLDDQQAKFDKQVASFQADKTAFEAMRKQIDEIEGDAQFKKALALYQSLRPKDASDMLKELVAGGSIDQVVAYLNAMESRKASKIIAQFDPPMAADLLERLRTRGQLAAAPEEP